MYFGGWAEKEWHKSLDDTWVLLGDLKIKRRQVHSFLKQPFFLFGLKLWARWRRMGLPYSCGWAEHPYEVIRVIEIIEEEYQGHLNDDN